MKTSKVKRISTVCGSTLVTLAAFGVITLGQVKASANTITQGASTTVVDNSQQSVNDGCVNVSAPTAVDLPTTSHTPSQVNNPQSKTAVGDTREANNVPENSDNKSITVPVSSLGTGDQLSGQALAQSLSVNSTSADALDLSWMNGGMNEGTFIQIRNQGVKYVIIQLTKGMLPNADPYAEEQVRDAYAAGLGVAAYHFTKFNSYDSAIAEANHFADRADQLHLPKNTLMFADVEDRLNMYRGVTNDLRAFFNQLNARGYWNHGVYTGLYFDNEYNVSSVVGRNRTWIAQYPYDHQATPARNAAKAAAGYGAWQYTGYNGGYNVAGYGTLDGTVDLGLLSSAIGQGSTEAANLDQFDINTAKNEVNVNGWFASYNNRGKDKYHYIILLDNNGHEIARQKVAVGSRPDVKNAYYYMYGSEQSGFSGRFSLDNPRLRQAIADGTPITIIFRDSNSADANSDYNDHWFNPQPLSQNQGCVDQFEINKGVLHVSGWHVADQSISRPYQWVIIYDQTTHTEVARQKAITQERPDLQGVFPGVYNAIKGGFSTDFKIANYANLSAALLHGDQLQVVARYTDDEKNGENKAVDSWLTSKNFGSASDASLDHFGINGHQLKVTGWYADDRSVGGPYRYIIIVDQTTGKEVARQKVLAVSRPDVAKAKSQIFGAGASGFDTNFDIAQNQNLANAIQNGDTLQVIARYTDKETGEGNYTQHWFNGQTFSSNQASLDNFILTSNGVKASGWHCSDQAANRPYHFDILLDGTTGQELGRVNNEVTSRADVAKAYPDTYNSGLSGFDVLFKMNTQIKQAINAGHQLQVVDRYTTDQNGNNDSVDYWFDKRNFNGNNANLDGLKLEDNYVIASGWHCADQAVTRPYHYDILLDATTGKELARLKNPLIKRNDVHKAFPNIYQSGQSGFVAKFLVTDEIKGAIDNGHQLRVVDRYTADQNGNGNSIDAWFNPQSFTANNGSLDNFVWSGKIIKASGWHCADAAIKRPYHFDILLDATSGQELTRLLNEPVTRNDVQSANPNVFNSGKSGFNVEFQINDKINQALNSGHQLRIIDRYSAVQSGNSDYVDYWFDSKTL